MLDEVPLNKANLIGQFHNFCSSATLMVGQKLQPQGWGKNYSLKGGAKTAASRVGQKLQPQGWGKNCQILTIFIHPHFKIRHFQQKVT
jgi:hypothetical protein